MARCTAINSYETATVGYRMFWRLQDVLPALDEKKVISSEFKLLYENWSYSAFLSCHLRIIITCISSDISGRFNVRAGIFGESGVEVVGSEAKEMSKSLYSVDIISYSRLKPILQSNEIFTFFLEIKRKREDDERKREDDEEKAQKKKVLKKKYQTDFKEMLLSGIKHDFTINVKYRKFYCHTNILSARSPVFSAMLEHEMKEKCTREVYITDSEPSAFQEFLLYLYTGSNEHLNWTNITELFKLADKYCVEDLKYLCVEKMKDNVTKENFFEFFLLSQERSDSELFEATVKFFEQNSEAIMEGEKWDELVKKNPSETDVLVKAL